MADDALICACCRAPMARSEAAPAPAGTPPPLRYHADARACLRVALERLAAQCPQTRFVIEEPRT